MLPLWLLWALRAFVAVCFGVLLYCLATSPRRRPGPAGDFVPGRDPFSLPDGTGSRISTPWSSLPPNIQLGDQKMDTRYWPGLASDSPVDVDARKMSGPWTGMALEMADEDDQVPGKDE